MKDPKPTTGYAFKYSGKSWEKSKSDSWDIVMISASDVSRAKYVGKKTIDGSVCAVFKVGSAYVAQTAFK
jgi:hypothetical protein